MALGRIIELQITPPNQSTIIITNLKITFVVTKSNKESANKAEISIYNLSKESILKFGKVNSNIILRAGYKDEEIRSLFFGKITSVIEQRESVDKILKVESYDGVDTIQEKNWSLSYVPGTSVQKIFNDIISVANIPLMNININLPGKYNNGYAFIGKIKDALTEVLNFVGKTWTIQNGQLLIISPNESIQNSILSISYNSGLINKPELLDDIDENNISDVSSKKYKIQCLMFPQLIPGMNIQIISNDVNGFFTIEKAVFNGDNYPGGNFTTELEVIKI